jgi:superoxide dismutase, Fe-Mn family
MGLKQTYKAKEFNLSGLNGISDQTLAVHFGLYGGYVTNTNLLNQQIADLLKDGAITAEKMPVFSELKRRFGFEYNGMVLHEYYFENMKKAGAGDADTGSSFYKAAESSFGSYEVWKNDFVSTGKMRGVGWAICYEDPASGVLSNHWINLHEEGNVGGYKPILVMDVWEHAFILDYKPAERPKYIEAFFSNIDWDVVNSRLSTNTSSAKV